MSGIVLQRLVARDPRAEHGGIWDPAGFHPRPGEPNVPAPVHLLPLPPHSPELNPVESIGDLIKDRWGNILWDKLAAMEDDIGEGAYRRRRQLLARCAGGAGRTPPQRSARLT